MVQKEVSSSSSSSSTSLPSPSPVSRESRQLDVFALVTTAAAEHCLFLPLRWWLMSCESMGKQAAHRCALSMCQLCHLSVKLFEHCCAVEVPMGCHNIGNEFGVLGT